MKYLVYIFLSLIYFTPTIVRAQEIPTTEPATESGQIIFNQDSLRPEIERLKISYRGLIEDYRNKEKQYQIAKGDYQQLNTLRSLEEAVTATREAIVARTDVLLTYFELLKLELRESEGIETSKKEKALHEIDAEIQYLRSYRETALAAQNKEQVLALTPSFGEHTELIEQRGYYSLSLILLGRLQAVHDKTRILQADIQASLNQEETAILKQSQRERAYAQTTETLAEANETMNVLVTDLKEDANKGAYNQIRTGLTGVYANVSLSLDYLRELLAL